MSNRVAKVHILNVPYHLDRLFDYYIPDDLNDYVSVGVTVTVPFGGGNKQVAALVFSIKESDDIKGIKPILSINKNFILSDEELKICEFLKEQTFSTIGDALRAIVPSAVLSKVTELYKVTDKPIDENSIGFKPFIIYCFIRDNEPVSMSSLIDKFSQEVQDAVKSLIKFGYVEVTSFIKKPTNLKTSEYLSSVHEYDKLEELKIKKLLRTNKQIEILHYLMVHGTIEESELKKETCSTSQQINALKNKGLIKSQKVSVFRDPYTSDVISDTRPENTLTTEQEKAFNELSHLFESEKAEAALLHGITGSGKTRVMIKLIDKAIGEGKQVIMLVPEIGLTPQTIGIFRSFYKDRAVVYHSSLSVGEKYDAWRKMRDGGADICIGTRSAIFAPFRNLGLIIIDEEHEHTYKSEQSPRYSAIDIARFRAAYNNSLLVLASATPSLSTYYKAQSGIYHLVELTERYNKSELPETFIYDLRTDANAGNTSPLGEYLRDEIENTLSENNQSILFMNRRGYHNFLICVMCGKVIECPHCSVAMTVHSVKKEQRLVCHYCGYSIEVPKKCPECAFEGFRPMGYGTQKVEEAINEEFPEAKILRMDADTTSTKFSYDKILNSFRNKEANILLGTQMVTKGHDFPDVTLVGVVLADTMLHLDDYAASERTFSLITQVIGRAGRSNKKGKAVIQTYSSDNMTLMYAAAQDYKAFYKDEIERRKAFVFPPFCDIALVIMSSPDEALLNSSAIEYRKKLEEMLTGEYSDVKLVVFGPFEASVYKINETYRMRFVIKCRSNKRTRKLLSDLMSEFSYKKGKKITIVTDMNPNSI